MAFPHIGTLLSIFNRKAEGVNRNDDDNINNRKKPKTKTNKQNKTLNDSRSVSIPKDGAGV